jgi:hypothetical protein
LSMEDYTGGAGTTEANAHTAGYIAATLAI